MRTQIPAGRLNQRMPPASRRRQAFLMAETLVYIGLLFLVLGIGYVAVYRSIDNSAVLSRNAADIANAVHAGERWRADVRSARDIRWQSDAGSAVLRLTGGPNQVDYRFADGVVFRRLDSGTWIRLLDHVKASEMAFEPRAGVGVWRWELELLPRAKASVKASRVRPLFTFLAVPAKASNS